MNYFIFYNKACVAYTDDKNIMKAFLNYFKNKEAFTVDKFKNIDKFYLEDQLIDDMTLYYHHEAQMFLNEGLSQEIYTFLQETNEEILNVLDRLNNSTKNLRLADNENYILSQFQINYGVMVEDLEWQLFNSIVAVDVLENHVFPSLNEQFNRKE